MWWGMRMRMEGGSRRWGVRDIYPFDLFIRFGNTLHGTVFCFILHRSGLDWIAQFTGLLCPALVLLCMMQHNGMQRHAKGGGEGGSSVIHLTSSILRYVGR